VVGQTISHYKILEKLGQGGMGEVWKAEDTQLRRTVALKFLSSETVGDEEVKARLIREAQASASLDHPNICQVFGIHQENNETFIAMAHIDGPSVADKIKERPLPLEDALDIALQIADGLHEAHEKGIVHRDVKPQNIMLTAKGQVKIMDFGLASLSGRSKLTKSGTTLGTPAYMSPEQLEGKDVDRRADVWALGCVLYEMLTQKTPFAAEYEQAIAYGILNEDPEPVSAQRADVTPEVDRLISKALAKSPAERYQHADDLLADLRVLQKRTSTRASSERSKTLTANQTSGAMDSPVPVGRSRLRIERIVAVALGIAFLGLLAIYLTQAPPEAPQQVRLAKFTLSPELPIDVSSITRPTPSPDGRYVAFNLGSASTQHSLWIDRGLTLTVWDAEQDRYRALTTQAGLGPFWSPDSRHIGLVTNKAVLTINVDSGAERTLATWPSQLRWTPHGGTWAPDGETIVFSAGPGIGGRRLYRMSASGGKYELLFEPSDEEVSRGGFFDPTFLPTVDGRRALLYAEGEDHADIGVINLETGERRTIISGNPRYGRPLYSPSGHVIYQEPGGRLSAIPFSLERLEPTGDPFVIAESATEPGISAQGMLTYAKLEPVATMQLAWRDRSGNRLGSIGEAQEGINFPVLSPDGKEVVAVGTTDRLLDIWIHEVDRPVKRRITFDETSDDRPTWLPSGKQVTFSGGETAQRNIWIAATDGSAGPTLFYESPSSDFGYEWSRDGKYLVGSGRSFLFYLRAKADGNGWEKVILADDRFGHVAPDLSPDGRYVAYRSDESGRAEVYVRPFPEGGGKWQISVDGGGQPRWQGDGSEIFYVKDDTLMVVPVTSQQNFTHGAPQTLFDGEGVLRGRGQRYDVTADGQRFVVVEGVGSRNPRQIQVVQNWYEEFRDRD